MPQGPIAVAIALSPQRSYEPLQADTNSLLQTTQGGVDSALSQTAAVVIKATPGRVAKVTIIAPGSGSAAFTLNDCESLGAVTVDNEVWSLPYNSSLNVAGAVFNLDWPFTIGIVLSAVPGAGTPKVSISYT